MDGRRGKVVCHLHKGGDLKKEIKPIMLIILFLVSHFNFLFIPYGRLCWLPISILLHVKYTLSYPNNTVHWLLCLDQWRTGCSLQPTLSLIGKTSNGFSEDVQQATVSSVALSTAAASHLWPAWWRLLYFSTGLHFCPYGARSCSC